MKIQIKKYLSDLNPGQKEVIGLILFMIIVMVFTFRSTEEVAVNKALEPDLLITSKSIQPSNEIEFVF